MVETLVDAVRDNAGDIDSINWSLLAISPATPPIPDDELLNTSQLSLQNIRDVIVYDLSRFNFEPNILESILLKYICKCRDQWYYGGPKNRVVDPDKAYGIRPEFWLVSFRAYNFKNGPDDARNHYIFDKQPVPTKVRITPELFVKYMHCEYFSWKSHIERLFDRGCVNNEIFLHHDIPHTIVSFATNKINTEVYIKYSARMKFSAFDIRIMHDNGTLNDEVLLTRGDDIPPEHIKHLQNSVSFDVLQKYEDLWNWEEMYNSSMTWEMFIKHVDPTKTTLDSSVMCTLSKIAPLSYIHDHMKLDWQVPIVLERSVGAVTKSAGKT